MHWYVAIRGSVNTVNMPITLVHNVIQTSELVCEGHVIQMINKDVKGR